MKRILIALLCFHAAATARAATLTAVPMQGTMVMPMISYDSGMSKLMVMMPTEIPQLTPLLVSNPSDSFDPADPWFASLDPSAHGLSFSRRYGFVFDGGIPDGTAVYLRKLSASPELSFYRYNGNAPKAWEPIFGTDGTPTTRFWNRMMFHPGVTAPPGTNGLTATFEAFLMDTNTMTEIAASGTGPMVLDFTNVDDGRPELGMALKFAIAWPTNTTGWVLEWAASPTSTVWTVATNVPAVIDGSSAVMMDAGDAGKVYRMRKAP